MESEQKEVEKGKSYFPYEKSINSKTEKSRITRLLLRGREVKP